MSHTNGEGDPRGGGGGVVWHSCYCAIHQQTNQSEVFGVLFNADKAQTSLYIFKKVGSCDESYQGEGGPRGGDDESFY